MTEKDAVKAQDEYEKAWSEEEASKADDAPATKAVRAARAAADRDQEDEYLRAYAELDKNDEPEMKDKTIVAEVNK